VINGIKYHVKVVRRGPLLFNVSLNTSNVDVLARTLGPGDDGLLLQVHMQWLWPRCFKCPLTRELLFQGHPCLLLSGRRVLWLDVLWCPVCDAD